MLSMFGLSRSTPIGHVAKVGKEHLLLIGQVSRFFGRGQNGFFRGELVVKVGNVFGPTLKENVLSFSFELKSRDTYHSGHKWRLHFSHQQLLPVDISEKGLLLDVFGVLFTGSQSSFWILAQQLQQVKVKIKKRSSQ